MLLSKFMQHKLFHFSTEGALCACVCMCVCCEKALVHVCFLLGRCFPILVTLHHSDRGQQIVWGGGGEGEDKGARRESGWGVYYSATSVIKCRQRRGRAEGPEFPELDLGGGGEVRLSDSFISPFSVFLRSKETLVSSQSVTADTVFHSLGAELHH